VHAVWLQCAMHVRAPRSCTCSQAGDVWECMCCCARPANLYLGHNNHILTAGTRALLGVLLSTRRGAAWLRSQPAATAALLDALQPGAAASLLLDTDTATSLRCADLPGLWTVNNSFWTFTNFLLNDSKALLPFQLGLCMLTAGGSAVGDCNRLVYSRTSLLLSAWLPQRSEL